MGFFFVGTIYAQGGAVRGKNVDPKDCEGKLKASEHRAQRWLSTNAYCDDQLRFLLAYIDYHRARTQRREWIEKLRHRVWLILEGMK